MIFFRKFLLGILFIFSTCLSSHAQDSVSVDELEFTEIQPQPAPQQNYKAGLADQEIKDSKIQKYDSGLATKNSDTLGGIFLAGFVGGIAALLMPCIFPMIPLTVSFFTKGAEKGKAFRRASLYGFFIILIYVVLGLLVTVTFGADALNSLSTNGIFNFLFFLLLIVFAISFFGAFELTLPSSWANKLDAKADKGGVAGLFFMAGTLALVSFSCTGPIIGTLLVQTATTGALLGPAVGMFGFSLALAIPFAIFALFPSFMSKLPKSGGWLNSVKVTLGFLELAFALKFLSNVDLAYHWEWFDREVFLSLWIVIFSMMGLYLLGKLRFAHDSSMAFISVPKLFLGIMIMAFTVYMIPGLWGAPLKSISAFLPPQDTQDFDLYTASFTASPPGNTNSNIDKPHKYSDKFHAPLKLNAYFDYQEGIESAKRQNKPVLIDFTGHACVNCRKMEANVWPDRQVYKMISEDYVLIQLYVDDKSDVSQKDIVVTPEGKQLTTIGKKWSDLQARKFQSNSQPLYVLLNPETEMPLIAPRGADYEVEHYKQFLQEGLAAFRGK